MATDIEEVEELKGTLEKQYGINIIEKDTPPLLLLLLSHSMYIKTPPNLLH